MKNYEKLLNKLSEEFPKLFTCTLPFSAHILEFLSTSRTLDKPEYLPYPWSSLVLVEPLINQNTYLILGVP